MPYAFKEAHVELNGLGCNFNYLAEEYNIVLLILRIIGHMSQYYHENGRDEYCTEGFIN